jgi:hypothetical protein
LIASGTISGNLGNWNPGYGLVLANEWSGGRPWLGSFDLVAIYDRPLDSQEVWQNYVSDAEDPVNRAPVAVDDAATVAEGGEVAIDLLANDFDREGGIDPASVVIVDAPDHGEATVDPASGIVSYRHDGSMDAADSFTYRVSDRDGETSATAEVSITVTPPPGVGVATVNWTPPTERVDGTPLDTLSGYEVRYGQDQSRLDQIIVIDNAGLTRYVVDGLGRGTWYFAVTAVDATGRRSALSETASKTFP